MTITVDLTGRRVLLTGASSGIGESTCRALVGCGATLAMLARRKERLDALHAELGEHAIGIGCDVTDLDLLAGRVGEAVRFDSVQSPSLVCRSAVRSSGG